MERGQEKMKVLFLCTGNSCRSQMAEGWARTLKGDEIEAYSAGVNPSYVHPRAIQVMKEAGVDLSDHESKHVDDLMEIPFDVVITVCGHAQEICPVFPGSTTVVHAPFDDPPVLAAGATDEEDILTPFRRVRDEIRAFVEGLPDNLKA